MTTKLEKITMPATPTDTSTDAMRDLRMDLYRSGFLRTWNEMKQSEAGKFFLTRLGLSSKVDYIAFRDHLKELINLMAAGQKPLKAAMYQEGGCYISQGHKDSNAQAITLLIEIRRAGKVWSADQAKISMAA